MCSSDLGGASAIKQNGMGAFQEERQVLIATPFCKFAHGVEIPARIPFYVEMAVRNAIYGRPGAVYLDMPDAMSLTDVMRVTGAELAAPLKTMLTAHHSGAYLLAAPADLTPLETITPQQVDSLVETLRREFDLTLVVTTPSITYEVTFKNGKKTIVYSPPLFPDVATNTVLDWFAGNAPATDEAFAKASHVTRLRLDNNRLVVGAMEPRAVVASWDAAAEKFTVHAPSQGAFGLRGALCAVFRLPPQKIRVISGEIGRAHV